MKSFENKESNYSLNNSENYEKELKTDTKNILEKVSELLIEYIKFSKDNIRLRNSNFSKFILIRGLDTVINVFKYILFYTKNINISYFYGQKAFYFYIEFVGQISEDEKMFLQLSSRDASTYVYKKTICEINNENKKNNSDMSELTKNKIDIVNKYISICQTILCKFINYDFTKVEYFLTNFENITKKISNAKDYNYFIKIDDICELLYDKIENNSIYLNVIDSIIKKTIKTPSSITKLDNYEKIISDENIAKLLNY